MSLNDILALFLIIGIIALMPVGALLVYIGFTSSLWPGVGEALLGVVLFLLGAVIAFIVVIDND
jgi:membrane protease YdiL (CAAX protease family)